MVVCTRKSAFSHNTSAFPSSRWKASCRITAVEPVGNLSSEVSRIVGSMGDSSSEVSAIAKSDRAAMLMYGDWVAGDAGVVSKAVTDSSA